MNNTIIKVVAGALIPSFATIIFNLLNFFFENYAKAPLPEIGASSFDIAPGCVFSIIGICVTVSNNTKSSQLLIICVLLILVVLLGMILPVFSHLNRYYIVYSVDFLAFAALSWAIREAG